MHNEISVRLGPAPGLEMGLLIYEADRDYWRYQPHKFATDAGPACMRHPMSDPSLKRLKRALSRLRGPGNSAIFRELRP